MCQKICRSSMIRYSKLNLFSLLTFSVEYGWGNSMVLLFTFLHNPDFVKSNLYESHNKKNNLENISPIPKNVAKYEI